MSNSSNSIKNIYSIKKKNVGVKSLRLKKSHSKQKKEKKTHNDEFKWYNFVC